MRERDDLIVNSFSAFTRQMSLPRSFFFFLLILAMTLGARSAVAQCMPGNGALTQPVGAPPLQQFVPFAANNNVFSTIVSTSFSVQSNSSSLLPTATTISIEQPGYGSGGVTASVDTDGVPAGCYNVIVLFDFTGITALISLGQQDPCPANSFRVTLASVGDARQVHWSVKKNAPDPTQPLRDFSFLSRRTHRYSCRIPSLPW